MRWASARSGELCWQATALVIKTIQSCMLILFLSKLCPVFFSTFILIQRLLTAKHLPISRLDENDKLAQINFDVHDIPWVQIIEKFDFNS